jgi:cytidylate kinase
MIIAVDGPAASGKGTVARALAAHYRLPHLDTGLLYRAVGLGVARLGGDPEDADAALAATAFGDALLADAELRSEAAGALASRGFRTSGRPRRVAGTAARVCGAALAARCSTGATSAP